ncbi:MAG TPA: hypothetical protein PLP57_10350 [Candidatus Saccharicenans sp.]|jgi:transcription elongation factor Elf1|nr:hypothetical protein [Candidatus Saccharicenans sp.]HRD03022.1 hypothetical protein [Candidatus Saccharicenans sp.]
MTEKKKKTPARKPAAGKKPVATKKPAVAKKPAAKKAAAYKKGFECKACGYRLIVDRDCKCGEDHLILCCGQPMKKVRIAG